MDNFAEVSTSLLCQGGSAKYIAAFFCWIKGLGKEPELGQQEQKLPFELIFGKVTHHLKYLKCSSGSDFFLFPCFCSFINVSCGVFVHSILCSCFTGYFCLLLASAEQHKCISKLSFEASIFLFCLFEWRVEFSSSPLTRVCTDQCGNNLFFQVMVE